MMAEIIHTVRQLDHSKAGYQQGRANELSGCEKAIAPCLSALAAFRLFKCEVPQTVCLSVSGMASINTTYSNALDGN